MNESWQTILARAQQSIAIWTQHAPSFTVGELTLAGHQGDAALLEPAGQAVVTQEDAVDTARNARDTTMEFLKDLAIRAPRKMDGEFSARDPFHADLRHIRVVEMTGLDTILTRSQRVLSLWQKLNTRNAAMVPLRPPFLVGGVAVAAFAAALASLPNKTQVVENMGSVLGDVRSDLLILKERVRLNNIRWYAAWQGEFVEGSPERNALSQIDTGSGGGGSGGGEEEEPLPPGVALVSSTIDNGVVTLAMTCEGATFFNVYQRTPGEVDFVLVAGAVATGWSSGTLGAGSGEWAWQVAGVANGVEGGRSAATLQGV